MIDSLNTILTEITTLLGRLYGLPGYVGVFLLCFAVGFILKKCNWFPNDGIPLAVVLSGVILMIGVADPRADSLPLRVWIFKNLIFGGIIGALAFAVHTNRRRIPLLKKLFPGEDTVFLKKEKVKLP